MMTVLNRAGTVSLLALALALSVTGCQKKEAAASASAAAAPRVVTFGTHWQEGDDATWRNDITGEAGMTPEDLRIAELALAKVKEELNVEIKWIQYDGDVREALLRSVLAGDPVCDLALLWGGSQGSLLGQNIFQDLEPYADVFTGDPDSAWMLMDPIFGRRYFLAYILGQVKCWPLVFNIDYVEKVDALKENGTTVYPTDLYKQGKWTWSVFEEYLTKLNTYYKNTPSPVRPEVVIKPYQTDYRQTAQSLLHTAGQAIYGAEGIMFDTPEAIQAIEYLDELMTKGLLMSVRYGDRDVVPGWTWNGSDFGNGETVFTDMVPWLSSSASQGLSSRGESMGLVPFPRPDNLAADDPRIEQGSIPDNTFAALKGVSSEQTRLALEAFKIYYLTMFRERAGSSRALDFLTTTAEDNAIAAGYDIFHEKIGADILAIYSTYSPASVNEFAPLLGVDGIWQESIVGQSIYGFDGSPKYRANVAQKRVLVENALAATEAVIASGKTTDNIKPTISAVKTLAIPRGADPSGVDLSAYITITDNVDGTIPLSKAVIDASSPNYGVVGSYEGGNGLHVTVKDAAGNERTDNFTVIVYDGTSTTPPVITLKETLPTVAQGTDATTIDFSGSYVDSVKDKDGLDVSSSLVADLSGLDVTNPGVYDVVLTATDYAGNAATVTIAVTVEPGE